MGKPKGHSIYADRLDRRAALGRVTQHFADAGSGLLDTLQVYRTDLEEQVYPDLRLHCPPLSRKRPVSSSYNLYVPPSYVPPRQLPTLTDEQIRDLVRPRPVFSSPLTIAVPEPPPVRPFRSALTDAPWDVTVARAWAIRKAHDAKKSSSPFHP